MCATCVAVAQICLRFTSSRNMRMRRIPGASGVQSFRDEAALQMHRENVHFFCKWCSMWFLNIYGLEYHNYDEHYRCSECDQLAIRK